jgi:hypothetical protein
MRKSKRWQVLVLETHFTQDFDQVQHLSAQDIHAITHLDQICIVTDEAARGTEMNDGSSSGALVTESMNVSHDIVTKLTLVGGGSIKVDRVHMLGHLVQLLRGDVEAELVLCLSQRDPHLAPRRKLVLW